MRASERVERIADTGISALVAGRAVFLAIS